MVDSIIKKCDICGVVIRPYAKYCKRCKKILDRIDIRRKHDKDSRIRALRMAWDGRCFRCYYTGIPLEEKDWRSPKYLTFDHIIPREEKEVVVAAAIINDMKSDMAEQEFKTVVLELANHFRGLNFKASVLNLKHFKR